MKDLIFTHEEEEQLKAREKESKAFMEAREAKREELLHPLRILRKLLLDLKDGKEVEPRRISRALDYVSLLARSAAHVEEREELGLGKWDEESFKFIKSKKPTPIEHSKLKELPESFCPFPVALL